MGHQSEQAAAYIDEEDCLGFKIWVAELELIVGGSRGKKKADAAQVFLLLQKLVITLDRTDRTEVREYQRRCEDALIDILLKGAPPPVRTSPSNLLTFAPSTSTFFLTFASFLFHRPLSIFILFLTFCISFYDR